MPAIHHALLIGAPAGEVYKALTSQEGLSAWWTPGTTTTATPGSVAHFPFGNTYFKEMEITRLQPSSLVEWTCIKGADEWIKTTLSFKLSAFNKEDLPVAFPEMQGQAEQQGGNNGSLLVFHHNGWKASTLMFAECSYTWGQFLRSLKLFCETGRGRPWPDQHSIEL